MAKRFIEVVEVRFLFWKLEMSRALMLPGVLAIDVLIGWLLSGFGQHPRKN